MILISQLQQDLATLPEEDKDSLLSSPFLRLSTLVFFLNF
jgi:hypothetical protein